MPGVLSHAGLEEVTRMGAVFLRGRYPLRKKGLHPKLLYTLNYIFFYHEQQAFTLRSLS